MNRLNKFKDVILAGAIGDAFGYFVEFDNLEYINYKYNGYLSFSTMLNSPKQWKISDDTQMTLFCLDAIQEDLYSLIRPVDGILYNISSNYFAWYGTQTMRTSDVCNEIKSSTKLSMFSSLYTREAPGTTCLEALSRGTFGTIEKRINDSKGCGGVMRVAPIAFLRLPYNQTFLLGAKQAALTHGHPLGYISAGVFALVLAMAFDDIHWNTPEASIIIRSMYNGYDGEEQFNNYLDKVYNAVNSDVILYGQTLNDALGEGWVGEEAMGIALYCASKFKTFSEVIEAAANHNGDSDSTASLAAQLFVAMGGELDPRCNTISLTCKDVIEYEIDLMHKNVTY